MSRRQDSTKTSARSRLIRIERSCPGAVFGGDPGRSSAMATYGTLHYDASHPSSLLIVAIEGECPLLLTGRTSYPPSLLDSFGFKRKIYLKKRTATWCGGTLAHVHPLLEG